MRQVIIQVPRGQGDEALRLAREHQGANLALHRATDGEDQVDLVRAAVANSRVEGLLDALERLPELHVTLIPRGVIALRPPPEQAPQQATDVGPRSPIEIYLSGLQSVGWWTAFVGYAAAAGVVVWIALFTEVVFLLTAAMLIAPFAGPAMNAALATARGDANLLGRSLLRYFAGLAVTIVVAFLLTVAMRQEMASGLMARMSLVASVAVLLPLVAGAAGALNLCQSERDSLVSGAATGMLVAASLAPPAGIVGTGLALGELGMVRSAAFVLLLQVVGINLAGALVFRLYGVSPCGARFDRGKARVSRAAWLAALALGSGLLAWQFAERPALLRSSEAQRAAAGVRDAVRASGLARLVQVDASFPRTGLAGEERLLLRVTVEGDTREAERIAAALRAAIALQLREAQDVTPLIDITVLEP